MVGSHQLWDLKFIGQGLGKDISKGSCGSRGWVTDNLQAYRVLPGKKHRPNWPMDEIQHSEVMTSTPPWAKHIGLSWNRTQFVGVAYKKPHDSTLNLSSV